MAIDDPATFHASMNALEQDLERRSVDPSTTGRDDQAEVTIRLVNAAFLQQGFPFQPAYPETIGANYGPVLDEVDFRSDPDAVAHAANAFVADATSHRIPELIADGVLTPTPCSPW